MVDEEEDEEEEEIFGCQCHLRGGHPGVVEGYKGEGVRIKFNFRINKSSII